MRPSSTLGKLLASWTAKATTSSPTKVHIGWKPKLDGSGMPTSHHVNLIEHLSELTFGSDPTTASVIAVTARSSLSAVREANCAHISQISYLFTARG